MEKKPIVIVGAGLAGLTCALTCHEADFPVLLLEKSDEVGGRVRTDQVDGFLLDRGFQVYLDAYPTTGSFLDLEALDLRAFEPGAFVFDGHKFHTVMDVFRRPKALLKSVLSPVGTILDKLRVAVLRQKVLDLSLEEIAKRPDRSTEAYLQECGFSKKMIDVFFRSFYGGIFLERELQTSSRMFEFTFRMFSKGRATVPAKGMGEIPKQLAGRLPDGVLTLNADVVSVERDRVTLANGEVIEASAVVVATEASAAAKLVSAFAVDSPSWRGVSNYYFAADSSPLDERMIALNGSGKGLINNIAVMSDISPEYAPKGKALISVSVIEEENFQSQVIKELRDWFGEEVKSWELLRVDQIPHALPTQKKTMAEGVRDYDGVFLCGDYQVSASIEGAVISGETAAKACLDFASL